MALFGCQPLLNLLAVDVNATAALTALLKLVKTRPLYGSAACDNAGSIRVLEKCGFAFVRKERGFAAARGEEIDEVVFKLS